MERCGGGGARGSSRRVAGRAPGRSHRRRPSRRATATRVGPVLVEEVRQRDDRRSLPSTVHGAREVGLLRPELGRGRQLREQVRDELVRRHVLARGLDARGGSRRDAGHQPGVVAEAVHCRRRSADAVLTQTGGALAWRCRRSRSRSPGRSPRTGSGRGCGPARRCARRGRQVEERRPEAGRRDHVVHLQDDRARLVVPLPTMRQPRSSSRSARRPGRARRCRPPGLRPRRAAGSGRGRRPARSRTLHRPRRDEDHLPRPGNQPVGELEAGVPLADHEDAAASVVLRAGACLRVVRHVLDAGDRATSTGSSRRSRRPRAAAVLAVGGDEDEPAVFIAPGRLPAAAVADADAGPAGRTPPGRAPSPARAAPSTSGPRSRGRGRDAPARRRSRLLWSYHSYARVPGRTGASGFDHESSRWKIGHQRNIPPGVSSRERTACSIAEPGEAVARLQAARAAPDDDDRDSPPADTAARPEPPSARYARRSCRRRVTVRSIRYVTFG